MKLTWHIVWSFHCSGNRQVTLGVTLIKLPLKYREQTGNPVVQAHIEDKLGEGQTSLLGTLMMMKGRCLICCHMY